MTLNSDDVSESPFRKVKFNFNTGASLLRCISGVTLPNS